MVHLYNPLLSYPRECSHKDPPRDDHMKITLKPIIIFDRIYKQFIQTIVFFFVSFRLGRFFLNFQVIPSINSWVLHFHSHTRAFLTVTVLCIFDLIKLLKWKEIVKIESSQRSNQIQNWTKRNKCPLGSNSFIKFWLGALSCWPHTPSGR